MKKNLIFIIILLIAAGLVLAFTRKSKPVADATAPQAYRAPVTLTITRFPEKIKVGERAEFAWEIKSAARVITTHTALHYGPGSHRGEYPDTATPQNVGYPNMASEKYVGVESKIPGIFTDTVTVTSKDLPEINVRAHVIISGKHYWAPEVTVPVEK